MQTALEIAFWLSAGLLIYGQFVYPLLVGAFARKPLAPVEIAEADLPAVTLIIAAYKEASVIAEKVANSLALDYPREKLQIIVACDGSPDDTPALARSAGADLVL